MRKSKFRFRFVVSILALLFSGIPVLVGFLWGAISLTDLFSNILSVLVYVALTSLGTTLLLLVTGQWKQKSVAPRLTIVRTELRSQEEIKELVVRFPNGKERRHKVRFCYVTVKSEGRTADDFVAHCDVDALRFIPLTSKATFGIDFDGSESPEEFDQIGLEGFVTALLRDHRRVKDEIQHVHPSGETFALFFTLEGKDDGLYIPAHTKVWYNIYGGQFGGRVIGHEKGLIHLSLYLDARDMQEEQYVSVEVRFDKWDSFETKLVESPQEV